MRSDQRSPALASRWGRGWGNFPMPFFAAMLRNVTDQCVPAISASCAPTRAALHS